MLSKSGISKGWISPEVGHHDQNIHLKSDTFSFHYFYKGIWCKSSFSNHRDFHIDLRMELHHIQYGVVHVIYIYRGANHWLWQVILYSLKMVIWNIDSTIAMFKNVHTILIWTAVTLQLHFSIRFTIIVFIIIHVKQ